MILLKSFQIQKDIYFYGSIFSSSITGILIHTLKLKKKEQFLRIKDLFWGVAFGIPNFFCLVFFL